ncbi:MAG: serine protein kinase RIO [Candidatus Helarchaeota archaeon]|nr:serine protein kinase RIO [Candidatus Helarchaeota archaeon]
MDERADSLETKIDKRKIRRKRSEDQSVVESVFDTETQKTIYELYNRKILDEIGFVISTGKEANVYYAIGPKEVLAVKIYRIKTAETRFMWPYVIGDPRFKKVRRKTRDLIFTWAEKEFKNLSRALHAKVRVPKPIAVRKNILVMEFIGNEGDPAPLIKDCTLSKPQKIFDTLLHYIKLLFQDAKLVHADLSEFNILYTDEPVIIDISQGVVLAHPNAREYLIRDIKNLLRFFSSYDIKLPTLENAYKYVTG